MNVVQNQQPDFEDIQPVIDDRIVEIVNDIFKSVIELTDDQKDQLRKAVTQKGKETTEKYLASINTDIRTKVIYGLVREKTTALADTVLSTIGQEVNRGAVISARAVQANSKNEKYDEILLRKTKLSGDITVPTSVIVISTNCVDVIKASCQEEKKSDQEEEAEEDAGEKPVKQKQAAADKPAKVGKRKKAEK